MNGDLALKYARTRHADSDYGRAARQQQVILAIKDKITQPGQMAALLPRIPSLTMAMARSVQTNMPVERAIALARTVDKTISTTSRGLSWTRKWARSRMTRNGAICCRPT